MSTSSLSPLTALSPIDGRYASKADALREWLSEAAFMRNRVKVEVHWLIALAQAGLPDMPKFSSSSEAALLALVDKFSEADAARIKEIEAVTNHDVKAVEYWLKEQVKGNAELEAASEFIHFACTSEDINNTSHGMMLKAPVTAWWCRRSSARMRVWWSWPRPTRRSRCCREPTASRPARPRSARKWPTWPHAWRAPSSASSVWNCWAR